MDRILTRLQTYINQCYSCTDSEDGTCGWFRQLAESNIQDTEVSPDQYLKMTYREEALAIHRKFGHPRCRLQVTFSELFDQVEEMIDTQVSVPFTAKDLNNLLRQMKKMESRLENLPFDYEHVFRAPAEAIIERCLTHIDYVYLENGLDIIEMISNVHGNHDRVRLLHDYYIEDVVDGFLETKKTISVKEIMSYKGDLRELAGGVTESESADPIKAEIDKKITPEVVDMLLKPEEEEHHSVNECLDFLANLKVLNFLQAVALCFGCEIKSPLIREGKENQFIEESLRLKQYTFYPWIDHLAEELSNEIKSRKGNEHEIDIYVTELLANFDGISAALYPRDHSIASIELIQVQGLAHTFCRYDFSKFRTLFKKAKRKAATLYDVETAEYYTTIRTLMEKEYFDENEDSNLDDVLANIRNILTSITLFESALEGALLINGIPHDYIYYEELTGVKLTQAVTQSDISVVVDQTSGAIKHYATKLQHRVIINMLPDETYQDYQERMSKGAILPITMPEAPAQEISKEEPVPEKKHVERPILTPDDGLNDIPTSGVPEVDVLRHYYFSAEDYYDFYFQENKIKFRQLCFQVANDKSWTREDKENWVLRVLQTIDSAYAVSDITPDHNEIAVNCMAREMSVVLECAFMQIADPICVKKIGMENDLSVIFRSTIQSEASYSNITEDTNEERMLDIIGEIGGNVARFERKMCNQCDWVDCPYRYIISGKLEPCIPEDCPESHIKDIHHFDMVGSVEDSDSEGKVEFRQLDGVLAQAQRYFEALYPNYVDENFNWKGDKSASTNYHAYWAAKIISAKFVNIKMNAIEKIFGIDDIRTYREVAKKRTTYLISIRQVFGAKGLDIPSVN